MTHGTSYATLSAIMQPPISDTYSFATFFSRERRRQRMLEFLEKFERRSWPGEVESGFRFPFAREDLRASSEAAPLGASR
jgi:hypothetical protein